MNRGHQTVRLDDDRGAVGVMVAVLMVPVLVVAALVVDVGAGYIARRQLQNAADAAALAVAQACASGTCGNSSQIASTIAQANVNHGTVTTRQVTTGRTVVVTTSTPVSYVFAPLIGVHGKTITRTSTASWGAPSGGTASLPIAFSWCAFSAQTNGGLPTGSTPTTIYLPKTDATACNGPSGNPVPGGFAWLKTDSTGCTTTSSISNAQTPSDPGRSLPSSCSPSYIATLQDQTILLPIYDTFGGKGSNAWYHIYAYAAFRLTGYNLVGQYKWNAPCSGSQSCLAGYFTVVMSPSEAFTFSSTAPDLGARLVALTA